MYRIGLLSLAASLCFAAGCATGDSSMTDINWDPGLQASLDGSFEAWAPPPVEGHDAGGATQEPDASEGPDPTPDASHQEASLPDTSAPATEDAGEADAGAAEAGEIDSGVDSGVPDAASGGDSSSNGNVCPATAQYAAEAAYAAVHGPTFCLTGTCPSSSQCCYEQLKPVNVCVAR
jgi:hypothetical protein